MQRRVLRTPRRSSARRAARSRLGRLRHRRAGPLRTRPRQHRQRHRGRRRGRRPPGRRRSRDHSLDDDRPAPGRGRGAAAAPGRARRADRLLPPLRPGRGRRTSDSGGSARSRAASLCAPATRDGGSGSGAWSGPSWSPAWWLSPAAPSSTGPSSSTSSRPTTRWWPSIEASTWTSWASPCTRSRRPRPSGSRDLSPAVADQVTQGMNADSLAGAASDHPEPDVPGLRAGVTTPTTDSQGNPVPRPLVLRKPLAVSREDLAHRSRRGRSSCCSFSP